MRNAASLQHVGGGIYRGTGQWLTAGRWDVTVTVMRGAGPIGYPGAAEVVNMRPPAYLIEEGVHALPCIGDGRQSGTSGSPSILNASPEAAAMGGLALLKTGDRVRIDLGKGRADVLIEASELQARREALEAAGGFAYPASQTPWQEIQRALIQRDQQSAEFALRLRQSQQISRRQRALHDAAAPALRV